MSKKEEKRKKIDKILDDFDKIQESEYDSLDFGNHLAKIEDLPDLAEIEQYDYNKDIVAATSKGKDVLDTLVDLYLSEFPELKKHPYILNKKREDALVYAETLFLQKMTRRNLISQLKQADNGDNSARMHEVINQTVKEIRENSKFASKQRVELERYYKDFKADLIDVYDDLEKDTSKKKEKEEDEGQVVSNKVLNDMINKTMNKDKGKNKE